MPVFGQTRAALAAAAARGADILSSLRLVMTAEALTAPGSGAGAGAEHRIGGAVRCLPGAGSLPRRLAVPLPGRGGAARRTAARAAARRCAELSARGAAQRRPGGDTRVAPRRGRRADPAGRQGRTGCPGICQRCCTAAVPMSRPGTADGTQRRCAWPRHRVCRCGRPPHWQSCCWTATARQGSICRGSAWRRNDRL